MTDVSLTVNGQPQTARHETGLSLLGYLRSDLSLLGTKTGCTTGNCGACTILLDGVAVQACQLGVQAAEASSVETIEQIVQTPLGAKIAGALIGQGAAQCGYCLPGIVVAAYAAFARDGANTDIVEALDRNLCRCGTHVRILRALTEVRTSLEADT